MKYCWSTWIHINLEGLRVSGTRSSRVWERFGSGCAKARDGEARFGARRLWRRLAWLCGGWNQLTCSRNRRRWRRRPRPGTKVRGNWGARRDLGGRKRRCRRRVRRRQAWCTSPAKSWTSCWVLWSPPPTFPTSSSVFLGTASWVCRGVGSWICPRLFWGFCFCFLFCWWWLNRWSNSDPYIPWVN